MNIWHDISDSRIKPDRFMAVIEIPKGGKQKYEWTKATGMLRLDQNPALFFLFTSHWSIRKPACRKWKESSRPEKQLKKCSFSSTNALSELSRLSWAKRLRINIHCFNWFK